MYKRYSLSNGMKVVTEHIPYVNSISIGVWIGSGSRYETPDNNGVSHFIEHMMFKGTKNRTAKKIAEDIEELGGQINAFTGKEATCFYVKLLDEHFDIGIDVLSDMMLNTKFLQEDIDKEKSVIQEEINMYEDSPEDLASELIAQANWGEDTLSYPILGTEFTIKNMTRDKILNYFNNNYVSSNMVISIAGNFNEEELRGKLEEKFGKMVSRDSFEQKISTPKLLNNICVKSKDIEQTHVCLTLNGIELGNDRLYTLLAINNYFGGGTSSRLFQSVREDKGYVYTIYSYPSAYKNKGVFNIYFALNDNCLPDALNLINDEIRDIYINKMDKVQIKKAKEQLKGNYILGLESISSRMFGIGKSELMLGRVNEPREILDKIDSITEEDIARTIEDIFGGGIISSAAVGRNVNEKKIKELIRRKV